MLAYSIGGDATITNSNYLLGVAGNAAYGAQVIANTGTATLTNTADGRIAATGYNVADAVFASGAVVNVTNNGTLTADGTAAAAANSLPTAGRPSVGGARGKAPAPGGPNSTSRSPGNACSPRIPSRAGSASPRYRPRRTSGTSTPGWSRVPCACTSDNCCTR